MKKVIKYILLGLLALIVLFISYRLLTNKLSDINGDKYKKIVNDINKDREELVFIEINPKLVLSIKNNKVKSAVCLNNDCDSIIDEITVVGKELSEAVNIIYDKSYEKGFNTEEGVKMYSTYSIDTKGFAEYVHFELIDSDKEKELLDNKEISVDNKEYEKNLLNELKKDKDYDKVYTCSLNEELECHIMLETGINDDSDYDMDTYEKYEFINNLFTGTTTKIMSTLKKFGFDVKDNKVIISGIKYGYMPLFTSIYNGVTTKYKNALVAEIIDVFDPSICSSGYVSYDEDGECKNKDGYYIIELNKVDISKGAFAGSDITEIRLGSTERKLQMYNIVHQMDLELEAWNERAHRCMDRVIALGYKHTLREYESPCCVEGEEVPEGGCYSCDPYENTATYCKKEADDFNEYNTCKTLGMIIQNEINCE